MTLCSPTLAAKLDRLFAFYHARTEPELTHQDVAIILGQRTGRVLDPDLLTEVRAGRVTELDRDVADALCALFGVDSVYLRESGSRDIDIDQRLCLWTLARDRGLNHLAARSVQLTRERLQELIDEIAAAPRS
jgi:hypothetical protein